MRSAQREAPRGCAGGGAWGLCAQAGTPAGDTRRPARRLLGPWGGNERGPVEGQCTGARLPSEPRARPPLAGAQHSPTPSDSRCGPRSSCHLFSAVGTPHLRRPCHLRAQWAQLWVCWRSLVHHVGVKPTAVWGWKALAPSRPFSKRLPWPAATATQGTCCKCRSWIPETSELGLLVGSPRSGRAGPPASQCNGSSRVPRGFTVSG